MTVVTAEARDRLREVRQRTASARERMAAARKAVASAKTAGEPQAQAAAEVALEQARGELEIAQEVEALLIGQMSGINTYGLDHESFLDDPETIRRLEQLGTSSMPIGNLVMGPVMSRDEMVNTIQTGSWSYGARLSAALGAAGDVDVPDSIRTRSIGVVPQMRRPLRLLDIIPTQAMDAGQFSYAQESGSLDSAKTVAEGDLKPGAELGLGDATVKAATIAAWLSMHRAQLADVAELGNIVNNRLVYSVLRRLETALVGGSGDGAITGVFSTISAAPSGTYVSPPPVSGDNLADAILGGITTVIENGGTPTGVVLNPRDRQMLLTLKADSSGEYVGGGPFGTTADLLWGVPSIASGALDQGQVLVGDWSQATLFIREPVNIRFSDSDQDAFLRNKLVALGEMRAGLAVWNVGGFCAIDLGTGTS